MLTKMKLLLCDLACIGGSCSDATTKTIGKIGLQRGAKKVVSDEKLGRLLKDKNSSFAPHDRGAQMPETAHYVVF